MAEVVRTLIIRGKTEGVVQVTSDLKGLEKAVDGVSKSAITNATASDTQAKRQLSLADAVEKSERRFNSALRAQQDFEKVQRQMNAAVAQNPALQERANAVLALAAQHFKNAGAANDNMSRAMQAAQSQASMLAGRLGAVGSVLTGLGPAGVAIAATFGALALALHQAATAALALAERAGKLKDFAETTGFTVIQLQALEKAGAQVGVSSESVTKGLERFSVAMDDVKQSTGPIYDALRQIDPELARQISRTTNLAEAWDLLNEASKKADLEQRNKLARLNFGRGGIELTRLQGASADAGGLAGLVAQLKQADVITLQQAEHWDTLGDKINENTKAAKQNVAAIFTGPTLEAMNRFSNGMLEISRIAREFEWSNLKAFFSGAQIALQALVPLTTPFVLAWRAIQAIGGSGSKPLEITVNPAALDEATKRANDLAAAVERAKAETIRLYNEEKLRMDVLGDAATASEKLKLKTLEMAAAKAKDSTVTQEAARNLAHYKTEMLAAGLSARISQLGEMASVEDVVRDKQNQLNRAILEGAKFTPQEIAGMQKRNQLLAESAKLENQLAFERAQSFRSPVEQNIAGTLRSNGIPPDSDRAKAIADYMRMSDALQDMRNNAADFSKTFVHGLIEGKSAALAVSDALKGLGMKLLDKGIDQLVNSAMSSITGALGGATSGTASATTAASIWIAAGTAFNAELIATVTAAAGILGIGGAAAGTEVAAGGAVAGVETAVGGATGGAALAAGGAAAGVALWGPIALLAAAAAAIGLGMMGGEDKAKQERQKALDVWEQSEAAANSWMRVVTGGSAGTLQPSIQAQLQTMSDFANKAWEASPLHGQRGTNAQMDPNVRALQDAYNAFFVRTVRGFTDELYNMVTAFKNGMGPDNPFEKARIAMRDLGDQLMAFVEDTRFATNSADWVKEAQLATQAYALSLLDIKQPLTDVEQKTLELNGTAQQLRDVLTRLGMSATDAAAAIDQRLTASLDQITAEAAAAKAAEIKDRVLSLRDWVTSQLLDTSTLAGKLIAFDLDINKRRAAEIEAGGEVLAELDAHAVTLRLKIQKDYNDQAIAEEQRRADEVRAANNQAARSVLDYINGLLGSSQSTLSPEARLNAAQGTYNARLALASSGNIDAQNDITKYAEDFRTAARAMYASSSAYQAIETQIKNQLLGLPAVQAATDPSLVELRNILSAMQVNTNAVNGTTTAVQGTTSAVGGTTSAVAGTTGAIGGVTTAVGGTTSAVGGTTATVAQGLSSSGPLAIALGASSPIVTALSNGSPLLAALSALTVSTDAVSLHLGGGNSIGTRLGDGAGGLANLVNTSNQLLELMKNQLSVTAPVALTLQTGNSGSSVNTTSSFSIQNNLLTGINKIVANTWAIAQNTFESNRARIIPSAYVSSPLVGWAGALAQGGVIPAGGLGLVSEHSPGGGRFIRAGAEPITVSPFAPGNDNSAVVVELRAVRDELVANRRELARANARLAAIEARTGTIAENTGDTAEYTEKTAQEMERMPKRAAGRG